MTTIITRLYQDQNAAETVVSDLEAAGFPKNTFDVISGADAAERMADAGVSEKAAAAYASKIGASNPLVVIRAPFTPFGAAKEAIKIANSQPSVDVGLDNENELISKELDVELFPRILRNQNFADFLVPLISKRSPAGTRGVGVRSTASRKPRTSANGRHGHWSTPILDIPLVRKTPRENSVYKQEMRFGAFLMPLLWRQKRKLSVTRGGGTPFSDLLGIGPLSRR